MYPYNPPNQPIRVAKNNVKWQRIIKISIKPRSIRKKKISILQPSTKKKTLSPKKSGGFLSLLTRRIQFRSITFQQTTMKRAPRSRKKPWLCFYVASIFFAFGIVVGSGSSSKSTSPCWSSIRSSSSSSHFASSSTRSSWHWITTTWTRRWTGCSSPETM